MKPQQQHLLRVFAVALLLGLSVASGCHDDEQPGDVPEAGSMAGSKSGGRGGAGGAGRGGAGGAGRGGARDAGRGGAGGAGRGGAGGYGNKCDGAGGDAGHTCGTAAVGGRFVDLGCPAEVPGVGTPCQTREPLCTYKRRGGPCLPDPDQLRQCIEGTWKSTAV